MSLRPMVDFMPPDLRVVVDAQADSYYHKNGRNIKTQIGANIDVDLTA